MADRGRHCEFLRQILRWLKGQGDEHLIDNITNGVVGDIGAMPAQKGVLSETEIKNVYAYIKETYKK